MSNAEIDHIYDNLILVMPIFHKRLLRMDLGGVTGNLTRHHLAIMGMLGKGNMTVSDLAKVSMVPKPQMTHLLDQLVALAIVERQHDPTDRRVINLVLTDGGRVLLGDLKQKVKENIKNRLAGLTAGELADMSQALETLRSIISRL
jgi:DNA-binding MarR family transcriptional regulator